MLFQAIQPHREQICVPTVRMPMYICNIHAQLYNIYNKIYIHITHRRTTNTIAHVLVRYSVAKIA